jgi:hypothetical protein
MTDPKLTPPPVLVQQWITASSSGEMHFAVDDLAIRAAAWGADTELDACCEYLYERLKVTTVARIAQELRAARRPKPPSLKEQAQAELKRLIALIPTEGAIAMAEPIRRALEALPE